MDILKFYKSKGKFIDIYTGFPLWGEQKTFPTSYIIIAYF